MNILFIYPNIIKAIQEQLGIAYLSAILKSYNIDTKLYDHTFQTKKDLINIIQSYNPDFIAVSTLTSNHNFGLELSKICKYIDPNIKIVFGGIHSTLVPKEVINVPFIDAVCVGESEFSLPEYILSNGQNTKIKGMYIKDKYRNIIYNDYAEPPDLDEIDRIIDSKPDHGLFKDHFKKDFHGNVGTLGMFINSRGCPFQCSYCSNHVLKKRYDYSDNKSKYTRYRKIKNVIKEIKYSVYTYGTNHIYMADDTFTFNRKHVIDFCIHYKEEIFNRLSIPFYCMIHANTINDEVMRCLSDSGCKIVLIGIESGSERIRNDIYNKNISDEQIINAINLAHKYNVKIISFNMIGSPTEKLEDAEKTLELNLFCNVDDAKMTILNAFPCTKLWDDISSGKYPGYKILEKHRVFNYYEETNTINPNMTFKEMLNFQSKFYEKIRNKRLQIL